MSRFTSEEILAELQADTDRPEIPAQALGGEFSPEEILSEISAPTERPGFFRSLVSGMAESIPTTIEGAARLGQAGLTKYAPVVPPQYAGMAPALGMVADVAGGIQTIADTISPAAGAEKYSREWFGQQFGRSIPGMSASIAGGVGGGLVAGPVGARVGAGIPTFVQEAGDVAKSIFDTERAKGTPESEALKKAFHPAIIAGAINAGVESFGGAEKLIVQGAKGLVTKGAFKVAKEMLSSALTEGAEELVQGEVSRLAQATGTGEYPIEGGAFGKEAFIARGDEALVGGLMGLGFGGATSAGQALIERAGRPPAPPEGETGPKLLPKPPIIGQPRIIPYHLRLPEKIDPRQQTGGKAPPQLAPPRSYDRTDEMDAAAAARDRDEEIDAETTRTVETQEQLETDSEAARAAAEEQEAETQERRAFDREWLPSIRGVVLPEAMRRRGVPAEPDLIVDGLPMYVGEDAAWRATWLAKARNARRIPGEPRWQPRKLLSGAGFVVEQAPAAELIQRRGQGASGFERGTTPKEIRSTDRGVHLTEQSSDPLYDPDFEAPAEEGPGFGIAASLEQDIAPMFEGGPEAVVLREYAGEIRAAEGDGKALSGIAERMSAYAERLPDDARADFEAAAQALHAVGQSANKSVADSARTNTGRTGAQPSDGNQGQYSPPTSGTSPGGRIGTAAQEGPSLPPATLQGDSSRKPTRFVEGERVQYVSPMGKTLTGTVRSITTGPKGEPEYSVQVDQIKRVGGVPIGRIEYWPEAKVTAEGESFEATNDTGKEVSDEAQQEGRHEEGHQERLLKKRPAEVKAGAGEPAPVDSMAAHKAAMQRYEEAKAVRNRQVPIAGPRSDEYVTPKGGTTRVIATNDDPGVAAGWSIYRLSDHRRIGEGLTRGEAWTFADDANAPLGPIVVKSLVSGQETVIPDKPKTDPKTIAGGALPQNPTHMMDREGGAVPVRIVQQNASQGISTVYVEGENRAQVVPTRWLTPIEAKPPTPTVKMQPIWPPAAPPQTVKTAAKPEPKPKPKPAPGLSNLSSKEQARAEELKAKIRAKLNTEIRSGFDPEMFAMGSELAFYYIKSGVVGFREFAIKMIDDLGKGAASYVKSWYNGARDLPGMGDFRGQMDPYDAVSKLTDAEIEAFAEGATDEQSEQLGGAVPGKLGAGSTGDVQADAESGAGADSDRSGEGSGGVVPDDGVGAEGGSERGPGRGAAPDARGPRRKPRAGKQPADEAGDRLFGNRPDGPPPRKQLPAGAPADFVIPGADAVGMGSAKAKFKKNIEAIELLRRIQEENRQHATIEEQALLSQYVGWGMFPQVFNEDSAWSEEAKQLRGMLTEEEYRAARQSTQNAHFTSGLLVDAIYQMLDRMGFQGGRVLEPSMGTGNFFGLMPADVAARSTRMGVERDNVTAAIAKLLYPQASIRHAPLEKTPTPPGFFDVVVGNVPFSGTQIFDRDYPRRMETHDYFIARSIDATRPGGLVALITSVGTMDKGATYAREYYASKADLVAAFRLPGGAFEANAGTAVSTDLLIFRRRADGEKPAGPKFTKLGTLPDPAGGDPIPVNEYFVEHPQNILGILDRTGTMYRAGQKNVSSTDDFPQRLAAAIESVPAKIFTPVEAKSAPPMILDSGKSKEGGLVVKAGKVMQNIRGALRELLGPDPQRVAAIIEVRDAARKLLTMENEDADEALLTDARGALNKVYDAFVKKYGLLRDRKNVKAFALDPDAGFIASLEDEDGKKQQVFNERSARGFRKLDKASSIEEAVGAALNESGTIDPARIAELIGSSPARVEDELVEKAIAYHDPRGGMAERALYLSGNVRQKLIEAKAAADIDPKFRTNVKALEAVIPLDIPTAEIDVQLGSPWVPDADYEQFVADLVGRDKSPIKVRFLPTSGQFVIESRGAMLDNALAAFATAHVGFDKLFAAAVNRQPVRVTYKDAKGATLVDQEATEKAQAKLSELRTRFEGWIWSDEARATRLGRLYNDTFNNMVVTPFDASFLKFTGMNPLITLNPWQKNAVWRIITKGRAGVFHEVGAGKTFTLVAAAMEMRRLGRARRPLIALPTNLIRQFEREARLLYPGARILSTASDNAEERRLKMSQIATADWDIILTTHEHLVGLPVKPETAASFVEQQINELEEAIAVARENDSGGRKGSRFVKRLEKEKEQLEQDQAALLAKKAIKSDNALTFEESGVDLLMVDEAHAFKKIPARSGINVKGIPTEASGRAADLMMKAQYLQAANKGRGVVLATGTPLSNSIVEAYVMQRLIQPDELASRNIISLDAWLGTFGVISEKVEFTAELDKKPVNRLRMYQNLAELQSIFRTDADVVFAEEVGLKRPVRKDEVVQLNLTIDQELYRSALQQRAASIRAYKGPPFKGMDILPTVADDGMGMSIDMRMVDPEADIDSGTKLVALADNIAAIHKANPNTIQMVFTDIYARGKLNPHFDLEKALGDLLEKRGIPREKVVSFKGIDGKKKAEAVKKLRKREYWIGLGGTKTLGTGVNAQKRLIALHHLDAPYTPADIEQRNGRGWRQGNDNKNILIFSYVTKEGFDQFRWGIVERKHRQNQQFLKGNLKDRRLVEEDGEMMTPEQIAAIASGNPKQLDLLQAEADLAAFGRDQTLFVAGQERTRGLLKRSREIIAQEEKAVRNYEEDKAFFAEQMKGEDDKPAPVEFAEVYPSHAKHTEEQEIQNAIRRASDRGREGGGRRTLLGYVFGRAVYEAGADSDGVTSATIQGESYNEYYINVVRSEWQGLTKSRQPSFIGSLRAQLAPHAFDRRIAESKARIAEESRGIPALERELARTWDKQGEVEAAQKKVDALRAEVAAFDAKRAMRDAEEAVAQKVLDAITPEQYASLATGIGQPANRTAINARRLARMATPEKIFSAFPKATADVRAAIAKATPPGPAPGTKRAAGGFTTLPADLVEAVIHMTTRSSRTIARGGKAAYKLGNLLLPQSANAIRKLGQAGAQLANDTEAVARLSARRGNTDTADMNEVFKGLSAAEVAIVAKIGQKRLDSRGRAYADRYPKLAAIAEKAREIADRSMHEFGALGGTRLIGGEFITAKGGGGWFPQVPNEKGREFLAEAKEKGLTSPRVMQVAEKMVRDGRARSVEGALARMVEMHENRLRGVNPYLERSRFLLPEEFVDWNVTDILPPLLHRNALLVEGVRRWGVQFQKAKALIARIGGEFGGDAEGLLNHWFRAHFEGGLPSDSSAFWGVISNYETMVRMGLSPLSVIRNLPQRFTNTILYEPLPVLKAFIQYPPLINAWIKSARAIEDKAYRAGAVGAVSELTNVESAAPGFKATQTVMAPFQSVERGNQVTAALVAANGLYRDMARLMARSKHPAAGRLRKVLETIVSATGARDPASAAERRVKRVLGLNDAQLLARIKSGRGLTPTEIADAMQRFTSQTQFPMNLATERLWWRSHPFFRTLAKFKPWGLSQVGFIADHVAKEAVKGNLGPLVRFGVAMMLAGELYNILRDWLLGDDESVTSALRAGQDGEQILRRLGTNFIDGGGVGMIADLTYGLMSFVGGPVATSTVNLLEALAHAYEDPGQSLTALRRFFTREVAVSKQIEGAVQKTTNPRWRDVVEVRRMAMDARAEFKAPTIGDKIEQAGRGMFRGLGTMFETTPNTLKYEMAARQIDAGDVEDASAFIAEALGRDDKTLKENLEGVKRSMSSKSPLGSLNEKQLGTWLRTLSPENRARAVRVEREWIRSYNEAIRMAIEQRRDAAR